MLVIFDLDGTLLNTIEDLACATNRALQACGFAPRTQAECCNFVGNGVSKLLERALPAHARTPQNVAQLRAAFYAYYNAHLTTYTRPYPGVKETLSALQKKGVILAVASNKYQSACEFLMHHFFPAITFAAVLGQRENIPLKPHPYIVQDILARTGTSAADCLYVGDSDVDMQTAHNAGVKACGVTWGLRPRETLVAYKPTYVIDHATQLLDLIL